MSPQNRMRLIRVAEFVHNPRFVRVTFAVEVLLCVLWTYQGHYFGALVMFIGAAFDHWRLKASAANPPSRRSR